MHDQHDKPRYPLDLARCRAGALLQALAPHCEKIEIVGYIRRARKLVGDIELLYIPKFGPQPRGPGDLFPDDQTRCNLADVAIEGLIKSGVLAKRTNSKGYTAYGAQNKLVVDIATGIPVDLFATAPESWENYRVCRTGGVETNRQICEAANRLGWSWQPYGAGFRRINPRPGSPPEENYYHVKSETDLFAYVGLPYLEPQERP